MYGISKRVGSQFKTLIIPLLFLLGAIALTSCNSAILRLGKFKTKEILRSSHQLPLFFFRPLLRFFFPKNEWENFSFSISLTRQICLLAFAAASYSWLNLYEPKLRAIEIISFLIFASLILDLIARIPSYLWSKGALKIAAPVASIYLVLFFPIVGLLLHLVRGIIKRGQIDEEEPLSDQERLKEMIRESELQEHLDPADQKLIHSFVNFKARVAKEIMVPRVDLFALEAEMSVQKALSKIAAEGYSRIPIFRENLDQIVGVILYKDLLRWHANAASDRNALLESIAKPVLYAPENKKIAQLLQEFRVKQIHMAIIVDEYGGTEGIVTIEDILEELVGEIEDEFDIGEEHEFWELPDGGWVVDAKMSIHDIAAQTGVQIPPSPEYETIGGYVFHYAGTIPTKGWRLSQDEFDLEVLSSNERSLKKIKIIPRKSI